MKRLLVFLWIMILSSQVFAHTAIDSLEYALESVSGLDRILILNELSEIYRDRSPQKSVDYGFLAYEVAIELKDIIQESAALNNIGTGQYLLGNYESALEYYNNALEINEELKDHDGIARSFNNMSLVFRKLGKYDLALDYNLRSLVIEESEGDLQGTAKSLCNIGNVYFEMNEYSQALENYQRCLSIYEELSDERGLADILNNIGVVYDEQEKFDVALDYYLNSLDLEIQLDNRSGIATTYNNIGLTYYNLNMFEQAQEYLTNSLELAIEIGENYGIANSYLNLGRLYLAKGDFTNAISFLNKGLRISSQIGAVNLQIGSYKLLSEVYSKKDDFDKALEYYKLYVDQREVFFEDNHNNLSMIQTQFEIGVKEREILLIKNRIKIYNWSIFFLILLIIVLIMIILLNKNKFGNNFLKEQKEITCQLRELAETDPLTNLANRRGMIEKIQHEKYRFERNKSSFVIIMCDIDGFKRVNDKFGHECGDFVLSSISNVFISMLRKQDMIGRWGGEEFIMLLPDTDLEGGKELAEKIRTKIEAKVFYYKGFNIWITLTLGVAEFRDNEEIKDTIHNADEAMYKGKSLGKNCVMY